MANRPPRFLIMRHRFIDALVQQQAVRQAGQGIMMGDVQDARLGELALGDIGVGQHGAAGAGRDGSAPR